MLLSSFQPKKDHEYLIVGTYYTVHVINSQRMRTRDNLCMCVCVTSLSFAHEVYTTIIMNMTVRFSRDFLDF